MRVTRTGSTRVSRFVHRLALVGGAMLAVAVAGWPMPAPAAKVRNPEDMLIVDCLLPGQVRKLGRVSSFMSARRPVRTTQADCEIRGGEFVSYDRANYQTALTVWLLQAEQGDAEAQNYVGEIYAKGLGTAPDYVKAAQWYEKSIAQGNRRAMINMGYLHEEGLGVPQDLTKALNLYRQASGTKDELLFASTVTAQTERANAEIATLRQTVDEQRAEADRLKAENARLKTQLDERRRALNTSQSELEKARMKLVEKQTTLASGSDGAQLNELQDRLTAEEKRLAAERAALERDRSTYADKLAADREKLAQLRAQEQQLAQGGNAKDQAELDRVRNAAGELALQLDDAIGRMSAMEAKLAANDQRLAAEQSRFEAERKKMSEALAASKQDRELLLLLEQQLAEKQREVSEQRSQIVSLERQVGGTGGGVALAALSAMPGPLLEIIDPPLTVTRGKPAAMVPAAPASSQVLGKVVARAGLASVLVNGQAVSVGANGLFKVSVPVSGDGSSVQVAAVDKAGTRTSLDFVLLPAAAGSKPAVASAPSQRTAPPSGVNLGKYYAVVIGNNDYAAYPKLSSAVADANQVGDILKKRYGFDTRVLVNATRYDILSALNDMREQLKPEDNLLVYFAGHGELDRKTNQGYWIPVDGQSANTSTWISNRAVSDILNTMNARHVLVVADSCYSGAMTRASVPAFNGALSQQQWADWVKAMNQSRSRTALTSGGLAPVPDSGGSGHSLFARAFITTLEDNSQVLEAQRLYRDVTASLALAATESTLAQSPEYAPIQYAGHEAGEFFFKPRG
jgi:hypothetical protein